MRLKINLMIFIVTFFFLSTSALLQAGVIPGGWEKMHAQPPGTQMALILKNGDLLNFILKEVDTDTLVVKTDTGEKRIPKVAVVRVEKRGIESDLLFQHASQPGPKDIPAPLTMPAQLSTLGQGRNSESSIFSKIRYVLPHPDQLFLARHRLWKKFADIAPAGDKYQEIKTRLLLGDNQLEIHDARTEELLKTVRYTIVDFAEYTQSRHPRSGVSVSPMLERVLERLAFEKKHWLILHLQLEGDSGLISHAAEQLSEQPGCIHFVVLQLDKKNADSIIAELESKAGIKILRVRRQAKPWPWQWYWQAMQWWHDEHWPPEWKVRTYGQGFFNNPDQKRTAEELRPDRWRDGVISDELDVALDQAYQDQIQETRKVSQEVASMSGYKFPEFSGFSTDKPCWICPLNPFISPSHRFFRKVELELALGNDHTREDRHRGMAVKQELNGPSLSQPISVVLPTGLRQHTLPELTFNTQRMVSFQGSEEQQGSNHSSPEPAQSEGKTLLEGTSEPSVQFKVSVDKLAFDARVVDKFGRPVLGLEKDKFSLYVGNLEREIDHVVAVDAPISVGLILDTSRSTEKKRILIRRAAIQFLKELNPTDKVMVASFDDVVHLDTDFTHDIDEAVRAINRTTIGHRTELYEAVYFGLKQFVGQAHRKVMILFTDGVDTGQGRISALETLREAQEADVTIYTIYFNTESRPAWWTQVGVPDSMAVRYLDQLVGNSLGTRVNVSRNLNDLGEAFSQIASDMRRLYTLAYTSGSASEKAQLDKIRVKVNLPGVQVQALGRNLTLSP